MKKWQQPFIDNKQYYVYTLGNHDSGADIGRREVGELDLQNKPWSLFEMGDPNIHGVSNYVKQLFSSRNSTALMSNFWIIDTNTEGCNGQGLHILLKHSSWMGLF